MTVVARLKPDELEIAKRMRDEGASLSAIAVVIGRGLMTVSHSLREAGYPKARRGVCPKHNGERSPELSRDFGKLPEGHPLAELDAAVLRDLAWLKELDRRKELALQELERP
jgi:hypothetical protein